MPRPGVQMWQGRAQSRRRCGSGAPSPGIDEAEHGTYLAVSEDVVEVALNGVEWQIADERGKRSVSRDFDLGERSGAA